MTPQERVDRIRFYSGDGCPNPNLLNEIAAAISAASSEARAEEREACARFLESAEGDIHSAAMARAIHLGQHLPPETAP